MFNDWIKTNDGNSIWAEVLPDVNAPSGVQAYQFHRDGLAPGSGILFSDKAGLETGEIEFCSDFLNDDDKGPHGIVICFLADDADLGDVVTALMFQSVGPVAVATQFIVHIATCTIQDLKSVVWTPLGTFNYGSKFNTEYWQMRVRFRWTEGTNYFMAIDVNTGPDPLIPVWTNRYAPVIQSLSSPVDRFCRMGIGYVYAGTYASPDVKIDLVEINHSTIIS